MIYLGSELQLSNTKTSERMLNQLTPENQILFLRLLIITHERAMPEDSKTTSLETIVRSFIPQNVRQYDLQGGFVVTQHDIRQSNSVRVWSHTPYDKTYNHLDTAVFFRGDAELQKMIDDIFPSNMYGSRVISDEDGVQSTAYLRKNWAC